MKEDAALLLNMYERALWMALIVRWCTIQRLFAAVERIFVGFFKLPLSTIFVAVVQVIVVGVGMAA